MIGIKTFTIIRNKAVRQLNISAVQRSPFSTTLANRSLFTEYLASVKLSVKEITPEEVAKRIQDDSPSKQAFHILDIRETYEWNEDHIPTAVYTGRGRLEIDIEGIVPDTYDDVVVYCGGGVRSILAAESLQKLGYKNVYSLKGGIGGWKQAGFPVKAHMSTYAERLEKY